MAKSTSLIVDTTTVITNGPAAASTAKAIAAAGPILDYPGSTKLCLLKLDETTVLLGKVITDTDAGDPNLSLLQGVQAALLGTSSPSTQLVTDLKTVYSNGVTAATAAKAIAAAGPIMDYLGNVVLCRRKLQETAVLLTPIIADTDAGTDGTNLGLLQNVQNALV